MTEKTLTGRGGDFLIHMESPQKCLNYGQITMPSSGGAHSIDNVTAYPLKASNVLAIQGEESSVVAFLIAGEPVDEVADDATTTGPLYLILDDFDGVVLNENMLPTSDCQAIPGTLTPATIKTAIEALGGKFVDEPTNTETQLD